MKNTIKMMLMLVILLAGYTAQTNASGVSSIPGHVKNQIKQQAKQKWPKDYSMQKYTIKKQEAAYKKILKYRDSKVPTNIINNLKRQAAKKWPKDYKMRLYVINKQAKAYKSLH